METHKLHDLQGLNTVLERLGTSADLMVEKFVHRRDGLRIGARNMHPPPARKPG